MISIFPYHKSCILLWLYRILDHFFKYVIVLVFNMSIICIHQGVQRLYCLEILQLMTHLVSGSYTERKSLERTLPDFRQKLFDLDR